MNFNFLTIPENKLNDRAAMVTNEAGVTTASVKAPLDLLNHAHRNRQANKNKANKKRPIKQRKKKSIKLITKAV